MSNTYAGGIYLVAATKDELTEYWAAATPRDEAIDTISSQLGPGWSLILLDQRLRPEMVAELDMRANSIRKLKRYP
jgi:hypothetical protein